MKYKDTSIVMDRSGVRFKCLQVDLTLDDKKSTTDFGNSNIKAIIGLDKIKNIYMCFHALTLK